MRLIATGIVLVLLTGCGQKGPLFLPGTEDSTAASAAATEVQSFQVPITTNLVTITGSIFGKPFSIKST